MAWKRDDFDAQVVRLEQELKESEQRRAELEQQCKASPSHADQGPEAGLAWLTQRQKRQKGFRMLTKTIENHRQTHGNP